MDVDESTRPNRRRRGYNSASDPDLDEEENEKRRKFLERNRYILKFNIYIITLNHALCPLVLPHSALDRKENVW